MEKILTISIAAYNVEKYIENTINSLLVKNIEDIEILVEDDGGTDNTANIVKEYEKKYPGIIKLVHKENGGYGSTINKSIELAQGKYFKQLDGDDWYDTNNFEKLVELLRKTDVDAVYTPYKEYLEKNKEYIVKDFFDEEIEGMYQIENIIGRANHNLSMYTMCYKTKLLRTLKIKLLHKCLYTDTQYALYPIEGIEEIYILHNPIYIYRIGRKEQSVSVESRKKHFEDHINVSKEIVKFYNEKSQKLDSMKLNYIFDYIKMHTSNTISGFLILLKPSKENLKRIIEYDNYILTQNEKIYYGMAQQSKIVKILRLTKYNYFIYKLISKLKIKKLKTKFSD